MKLSPYILHTDTDEGRVYYNTKNNHSFFISSRLVEKMKDDVEIQNQYESYLKSYHYNQED
ncbi:radical SAM/SPASM domain-containing protein, partial [Enterococcus cecorum]|nr:radical SAM/SPASM domain-containing protein [Enterococcus cecorum]